MDTHVFLTDGIAAIFAVGVISAVIVAYGVQFLLSTLSLAAGLSLTPNIKEKAAKAKAQSLVKGDKAHTIHADDDDEDDSLSMMTVTSAVGAWALITSSIALFVGSYFGVLIIPIPVEYAVVAGLVIWALFFLSMVVLEYKMVSTVVGGLIHSAVSGLRGTADMISGALVPSKSKSIEKQARQSIRAIYDEVDTIIRKDNIDKKLGDYIEKLVPSVPTMKDIDKELHRIIESIEVEHKVKVDRGDVVEVLDLHFKDHPKLNSESLGKLKAAANTLKQKVDDADGQENKVAAVVDHLAPVSDEKAAELRQKFSQLLESTSNPELSSDKFKQDIVKLFDDPKSGADSLKSRLALFDKSTIKELVNQNTQLDAEKSDRLVEFLAGYINRMSGAVDAKKAQAEGGFDVKGIVTQKLRDYLDGLDRPELNYFSLKRDAQLIMEEPGSAPEVIRERLQSMDKDSLVALLSSNSHISEEQAIKAADSLLEARDKAIDTYTSIETEVSKRYQMSRRKMVIYAERVRKNSIAAAWWLVGSTVVSAAAAVGGALLSV